ncbi:MAG: hypothetical protein JW929_12430 [Anaerolineales bacterium]|nr:hypothetical protein [Anaerolineales bacterium]
MGGSTRKDGELTARLGESLHRELFPKDYRVYYDHGPSDAECVGAIAAYWGDEKHRDTKLADLDIAIVDPKGRVILLIEIEESDDRPKTILGDAMAVLTADHIDFEGERLDGIGEWTALLIISKGSGEGHERRRRVIEERLEMIRAGVQPGRIRPGAVKVRLFEDEGDLRGIVGENLQLSE